jgi:hypothetical protein
LLQPMQGQMFQDRLCLHSLTAYCTGGGFFWCRLQRLALLQCLSANCSICYCCNESSCFLPCRLSSSQDEVNAASTSELAYRQGRTQRLTLRRQYVAEITGCCTVRERSFSVRLLVAKAAGCVGCGPQAAAASSGLGCIRLPGLQLSLRLVAFAVSSIELPISQGRWLVKAYGRAATRTSGQGDRSLPDALNNYQGR